MGVSIKLQCDHESCDVILQGAEWPFSDFGEYPPGEFDEFIRFATKLGWSVSSLHCLCPDHVPMREQGSRLREEFEKRIEQMHSGIDYTSRTK